MTEGETRKDRNQGQGAPGSGRRETTAITVGDLMTRDFETLRPDTPIAQCIRHFSQRGCRDLVVTDSDGRFLGVITPFDFLTQISPTIGVRSRKKSGCIECILSGDASTAEDIMTRRHIAVNEDTPISEALRLLEKYHHPDLVVINREGIAIGVVEICTIISHLRVSGDI
ncbi:MAG: CBS domain protein [Methanoregulaceae archaeon PtaU1.Bin059]|nr:MAG: CBS domain protein [Methanoregulaceae archaeon PtaB.Bin152]OPY39373.1 MAG: CBS domain protein [Methanoregulaceae archaeon PtaU1.Bin059]